MTIGSGLGATWGLAQEETVGTFQTPTRWLPVTSDKVKGSKKTVQSQALSGSSFEMAGRRRIAMFDVTGPVELDVTDQQLGIILQNMIGSSATAVQQGDTAAYLQVHTPGDTSALSLSLQSGRPTIEGDIQAFSYNGCKIADWELSVTAGGLAKLVATFDGVDESVDIEYTAASYISPSANVLAFTDVALLLGGTATTTDGVVTVADGAEVVGTVKTVSIKGQNGLAVDRQNLGSLTKRNQLMNAFRKYTGSIEVEFANLTDLYNAYRSDDPLALQFSLTGVQIAEGYDAFLDVICPSIRFNGEPPETDGPAILTVTAPFDILDDGTDPTIQFSYQSIDTAV